MFFPKYIELASGHLVIFSAANNHIDIARHCCDGEPVRSAGLMCATPHPRGKFWGESTTLGVCADKTLDWSTRTWWQGVHQRQPIFASSPALLQALGATDCQQAAWYTCNGCLLPSASPDEKALYRLAGFFEA